MKRARRKWKHYEGRERHHDLNLHLWGIDSLQNLILLKSRRHHIFHKLFGDKTVSQVADLMEELFGDKSMQEIVKTLQRLDRWKKHQPNDVYPRRSE